MGDLSSGCGCGGRDRMGGDFDCCSIIWILFLLSIFCGRNGNGFLGGCGDDCCGDNNSCMWLILLLIFCGGSGFGLGNRCGCCDRDRDRGWKDTRCGDGCGC